MDTAYRTKYVDPHSGATAGFPETPDTVPHRIDVDRIMIWEYGVVATCTDFIPDREIRWLQPDAPRVVTIAEPTRIVGRADRIARNPQIGSLRFAFELAIPDLRAWPVQRFPDVVFSVESASVVDVWTVLCAGRDIPATLEPPRM